MPFSMETRLQPHKNDPDEIAWDNLMNIAGTTPFLPGIAEFLEQEVVGRKPEAPKREDDRIAKIAA